MLCGVVYGQYTPMNQKYKFKSVLQIDSAYRMLGFNDTATLNTYKIFVSPGVYQFVKDQPGWMVRVGNSFLMRNAAATAWLEFVNVGSGSTSSASTWLTTGNLSPLDPSTFKLGHRDSFPLMIYTNNIKRLEIAAAGVQLQTITGSWLYAAYNTSNGLLGYAIAPVPDTFDFPIHEFIVSNINVKRFRVELDTAHTGGVVPTKSYGDSAWGGGGSSYQYIKKYPDPIDISSGNFDCGVYTAYNVFTINTGDAGLTQKILLGSDTTIVYIIINSSSDPVIVANSAGTTYDTIPVGYNYSYISLTSAGLLNKRVAISNAAAGGASQWVDTTGGITYTGDVRVNGNHTTTGLISGQNNINITGSGNNVFSGDDGTTVYRIGRQDETVFYIEGLSGSNMGYIDDGGLHTVRFGINTNSPTEALDVLGNVKVSGLITGGNSINITGGISIDGTGSDANNSINTTGGTTIGDISNNVFVSISGSAVDNKITISSPTNGTLMSGLVQMDSYTAGAATFDASGNVSSVSDERLKKNIHPYIYGLKEILGINPITYQWNSKQKHDTVGVYAGFSAQNVKANLPLGTDEAKTGEKYLSLQDRAIMAALVNSVKELSAKVDAQQKEIIKLKLKIKKK